MNTTTRLVTMPDDHWDVIDQEARSMGLSVDQAIKQAIRLYQRHNHPLPEDFGKMMPLHDPEAV